MASDLTDGAAGYDFVALDDVTPTVWPTGNVLAIHTYNTNWFEKVSQMEAPAIVDWRATHPVLRYVGFDNVQIAQKLAGEDADVGSFAGGFAASAADHGGRTGAAADFVDRRSTRWKATGRCGFRFPFSSPTRRTG